MLKMGPIFQRPDTDDLHKEFMFNGHCDVYTSNNIPVHLLKIIIDDDNDSCLLQVNIEGTDIVIWGEFPSKVANYVIENTDYRANIMAIVGPNGNLRHFLHNIYTCSSGIPN